MIPMLADIMSYQGNRGHGNNDGNSSGRFHYDDAEDGFGFMCRFISDVAALDSTGTPILRVSDWAKYAAIPLAVEQAKAEMQSLQALE